MDAVLSQQPKSARLIIASIASYNVGITLLWLQPMIVAELIGQHHFSSSTAGTVVTAAMFMESAILLGATRWRGQVLYRPTALLGVGLILAVAIAGMLTTSFLALCALPAIAAVGFGLLMLVSSLAPASLPQPERIFGWMYSINLLFSSALLFLAPQIGALFGGHAPAYPALILLGGMMLPFIAAMPRAAGSPERPKGEGATTSADGNVRAIRWLALGVAAVGLAYGQVWPFFVVLGTKAGLTADQANSASGLALIGALVGSLLAGRIGAFFGGRLMLRLSVAGIASSLMLLIFAPAPAIFVAAGMAAMFFMYLFFPTVLGVAAACDPSGHGVALINGALALLSAAGPMVAGFLITVAGMASLSIVTLVASLIALVAFILAWRGSGAHNQTA